MTLSTDTIIRVHHRQFRKLAIAPDDQDVLVVCGDCGLPYNEYTMDRLNRSIWKVHISDGKAVELINQEEDGHAPNWSPDGHRIVYLAHGESGKTELWTMMREGEKRSQITHSDYPTTNPFDKSTISWAPDSRNVAYTLFPKGGKYVLAEQCTQMWRPTYSSQQESIVVCGPKTPGLVKELWSNPKDFCSELWVVDTLSKESRLIAKQSGVGFQIIGWRGHGDSLLVNNGRQIEEIDLKTRTQHVLHEGTILQAKVIDETVLLARRSVEGIEIGRIRDGQYGCDFAGEVPGHNFSFLGWSRTADKCYGTIEEGVTTCLVRIDMVRATVTRLTPKNGVAFSYARCSGERSLNCNEGVVFPFEGPAEPPELWIRTHGKSMSKLSSINSDISVETLPTVEVISYLSEGTKVESLLVIPNRRRLGRRMPALVYCHGGPEAHVSASFTELISASAQSAAHWLASEGYCVLLPNFRGSSGYGPEFQNQISNYRIMDGPFSDLMAGADFLINEGLADPNCLGIYGSSFGGWLTAWSISQTQRFKGALAALGMYDMLRRDRTGGTAFQSLRANRLGNADPMDMWHCPEVYKRFSAMEHVSCIRTPTLLIETAAEREAGGDPARTFFNGLLANGVEAYLAYYPNAFHQGGWNDEYKKDYLQRLVAWFDHCLKGQPLPDWFIN